MIHTPEEWEQLESKAMAIAQTGAAIVFMLLLMYVIAAIQLANHYYGR